MLDGLILFRKVIFAPKYVFRVDFEGGFLGSARNFWGNPYLKSTTVLFDVVILILSSSGNRNSLLNKLIKGFRKVIPHIHNTKITYHFIPIDITQ